MNTKIATAHHKRKEKKVLEALDLLAELSEEIRADLALVLGSRKERDQKKLEEREVIANCYRELIAKDLLEPDIGIDFVNDIKDKNNPRL